MQDNLLPAASLAGFSGEKAQTVVIMQRTHQQNHSPALLKAIELILASPKEIIQKVGKAKEKSRRCNNRMESDGKFKDRVADSLIAAYSTKAGLSGGATALVGIVPGIGTAAELFGGATADMALCLKYQVEMCMALACLYGHDIETEADRKKYFIIAGLGALNTETLKQGSEQAARLFTTLVQRSLRNAGFDAVHFLFKKLSIRLGKKAFQKAIPFGVGVVVGFSSNKALTWMVGRKAKVFFASAPVV
jgi:uncharacterized protein (DUF697 family)